MARVRHARRFLPVAWTSLTPISSAHEATFVEIVLCNTANSAQTVQIMFVSAGATPGNEHLVVDLGTDNALQAGETRVYSFQPFLQAGDYIRWKAQTASTVTAGVAINEEQ